jgi:hypothetical protein
MRLHLCHEGLLLVSVTNAFSIGRCTSDHSNQQARDIYHKNVQMPWSPYGITASCSLIYIHLEQSQR